MSLAAGQTLTHYEILGPLGAGGMGEVYRARDTRLGREVAIKVLPEEFVEDEERLKRFDREARVLASLNHPNVAAIHGIDQVGGTCFLALELVPGENLDERLRRGALPVEEAIEVCRQIAEGVEAAHEAGIVHRDLKPANVHLTPEGVVKVLDFGLAKTSGPDPVSGSGGVLTKASPDSVLATEEGLVLGTPTYMAPEQARGRTVDRRADIWAFGCVLYECLTGKRAFGGASFGEIVAGILEREPDWSCLPRKTPARLVELIKSCLAKDPRRRLRDVGDARLALDRLAAGETYEEAVHAGSKGTSKVVGAALLGLVLGVVGTFLAGPRPEEAVPRATIKTTSRIEAPPRASFQLFGDFGGAPAFSPDGTKLAFIGVGADGLNRIWVRALRDLTPRALPGTEGAYLPFWSPDGRSLGFFSGDALCRIDLDGGAPLRLAGITQGKGGSWGPDGTILYAPNFASELFIIPEAGGTRRAVTKKLAGHTTHRWPQFLPGGRRFLFFAASHDDLASEERGVYLGSLDDEEIRFLVSNDSNAIHAGGYLLLVRDGVLLTQPFDAEAGRLTGEPRLLLEDVLIDSSTWRANVGASRDAIAYQPRGDTSRGVLQWVDRTGEAIGSILTSGSHLCVNLSPDGRLLAVESQVAPNSDIWIHDLEADTRNKLTLDPTDEGRPVWSPDGKRVAFQSNRGDGTYRIYVKEADGSRAREKVFEQPPDAAAERKDIWPDDWSPDGRYLLVVQGIYGAYDKDRRLCVLDLESDEIITLAASGSSVGGNFSPDGRWLAFTLLRDGKDQVFISRFSEELLENARNAGETRLALEGVARWQISYEGGSRPRWRGDGKELYYIRADNVLMAVELEVDGDSLRVGASTPLFAAAIRFRDYAYDVTPDGQRFLLNTQGAGTKTPLVLVTGWTAGLER